MSFSLLVSLVFFLVQVQGQGNPLPINISLNLNILNAERRFWGIPILLWNNDLQKLAQTHANTCNIPVPDFTATSNEYAAITGVPFNPLVDPLTRVGEIHAGATPPGRGINTDYFLIFNNRTSGSIARSRNDYDCPADVCRLLPPGECAVYKQVVWKQSQFVGCAISNCPNATPNPLDFIVCLFTSNGNWNGEKTFGYSFYFISSFFHFSDGFRANQTSVCDRTYVEQPPTQPPSCSTINCTSGCQNPGINQIRK